MLTVSFCITSYHKDIHHIDRLLDYLSKQTQAPDELILYCSGIDEIKCKNDIIIANQKISIRKIIDREIQIATTARNTCAQLSTSDFVIFFDIDDIPHPQKIEITKRYIEGYDFLVHSYKRDYDDFDLLDLDHISWTDKIENSKDPRSSNLIVPNDRPITHGHLAVSKKIFNTYCYDEDLYGPIDLSRKRCHGEDGKFCQKLIKEKFNGIFIDAPLIIYT